MEYTITTKTETAKGYSVVGTREGDTSKIIQLTGLTEAEAKKLVIGAKIKVG